MMKGSIRIVAMAFLLSLVAAGTSPALAHRTAPAPVEAPPHSGTCIGTANALASVSMNCSLLLDLAGAACDLAQDAQQTAETPDEIEMADRLVDACLSLTNQYLAQCVIPPV